MIVEVNNYQFYCAGLVPTCDVPLVYRYKAGRCPEFCNYSTAGAWRPSLCYLTLQQLAGGVNLTGYRTAPVPISREQAAAILAITPEELSK